MEKHNKYQMAEYASTFKPPSQSAFNSGVGELSNNPTNSYMNFTSISQTSSSSHDKVGQPQDFVAQVFKLSPVESTAPQITQTVVSGECCTECCPVAAAQAASSARETESNRIMNDPDLSNHYYQPQLTQSMNNYDNFPVIPPENFRQPSAFRSITSPQLHKIMQKGISSLCVSNSQKESMTFAHVLDTGFSIKTSINNMNSKDRISEISKSYNPSSTSNSPPNSQDVVSQNNNASLFNDVILESNITGKSDNNTLGKLLARSSTDIEGTTASSSKDLMVDSVSGTKRKHDEILDEARCLWATCAAVFRSIDDLIPHLSKLHVAGRSKGNLCRWESCLKEKEGSDELIQHLCSDHLRTQNPQHGCKWQGCYLRFVTFEELTGHVSEGHIGCGRSQYICYWEQCDRKGRPFTQRQKVMRHIQTHTGDKPYQCTVCKKRFSEANIMTQHMRTHTGEKPYKCPQPECDKTFSISGALTIHLRVHTGEKPFKCKFEGCVKYFAESSNLTKHMRVHTGERPFKCPVNTCNKKFSRPDQVTRHQKTHIK